MACLPLCFNDIFFGATSHHRTLKMIQFLVSYFFALNLVNKGFSAFVDVFVLSADAVFIFGLLRKCLIVALRENQ